MVENTENMLNTSAKIKNLEIPGNEGQLGRVRDFIAEVCTDAGFTSRETNNAKLAVDEACTNIIKHAYASEEGNIKIKAVIKPGSIDVSLLDTGRKFDFASVKDPDLDQYVESGRKGGLGVFLINRLMDDVNYRTSDLGNELILSKRSHTAIARAVPGQIAWRDSLRFKFTLRASTGLFLLVAIISIFTFVHQTSSIHEQKATQWMERRRLAENLASKSKDLLLNSSSYSIEQTSLSAYLSKLLSTNKDLAYARVIDSSGKIMSSSYIDEIFSDYEEPKGEELLAEPDKVTWKRFHLNDQFVRDIAFPVTVRETESNRLLTLGTVHLGIYEDAVESSIKDPRAVTLLLIIGTFLLGILLIVLLVSIFVRPIQILTDGVKAIGEGSFDGEITVDGPAEIGAIASVFNEITHKFKKAQNSILEQEKLQKEMEVAKDIQQSLLPKKMPDVSGYDIAPLYHAAAEVGGDYYDFVEVDDDTVGVVVADVSGKGVPGSLVMTMIRTALRMEARGNKNASDVMAKMNEFVTDDMKKGMFVTMFYVILDSKNRIISYASAGHNPMILYRYESNETFFLNPKGFPVGISLPDETLFRQSINVEKIKLKKDDMLIIYTDGVTEAMDQTRKQYGEERLLEIIKKYGHLHPKEFIAKLEIDIKKFTGGYPQNDDITIVAIKEKLTADDVLYGIRKKLIEMVDVGGMSVREACSKMRVSPSTYYRYKKRLEVLGERGLRNKILREDLELKRMSLEDRKQMLEIIRSNPEYGAKRITIELNKKKDETKQIRENIVYDELKRLSLNTKDLRLEYLRRYHLLPTEKPKKEPAEEVRKRIVEEFLQEVSKGEMREMDERGRPVDKTAAGRDIELRDLETSEEAVASVEKKEGDITLLRVNGHLDSVSTSSFEKNFTDVIRSGSYKLIVDLSNVSYISSGGWGIFTGEVKKLREKGGDVVLVGMTPEVYDVFELLGFGEILMAMHTVDEALDYFGKPPEERLAMKETRPAGVGRADVKEVEERIDFEEAIPGESYVPEWESLRIEASTVGSKGDIAVVSLNGIIDTVSSESLRKALDRVISGGIHKVVVDMSQVEYVSSGGWGTFTERLREVRRSGGDIKLFGMDPDVYYVFTMLGFNIVLSSFDILTDAIEDFGRAPTAPQDSRAREILSNTKTKEKPVPVRAEEDEEEKIEDVLDSSPVYREAKWQSVIQWEEPEEGVLIAHISNEIVASVIDQISNETGARISEAVDLLIFDLSEVPYISSAGWGIFSKYYEKIQTWGGQVALCGMRQSLYEIYSCLGFHSFLKAYASSSDAIKACKEGEDKRQAPGPVEEAAEAVGKADADEPGEAGETIGRIGQTEENINAIDMILKGAGDAPIELEADEETAGPDVFIERADSKEDESPIEEEQEEEGMDMKRSSVEINKSMIEDLAEGEWMSKHEPPSFSIQDTEVDLDKAIMNQNAEVDEKLRKWGWDKYGEKLKVRTARPKKKSGKKQ